MIKIHLFLSKFSHFFHDLRQLTGAVAGDVAVLGVNQVEGGETVLDAISGLGGLSPNATEKMWIARPSPDKVGMDIILPVFDNKGGGAALATPVVVKKAENSL